MTAPHPLESDPTVAMTRDLIRIDTQNWGNGTSSGEREATEYLAAKLRDLGSEPVIFESEPNRASVVARIPGRNPNKPALVVHGHTDVVPADATHWSVDPFAAEVRDGMIWGRGAVDMKNMDAMIVTALERIIASGDLPERELIVAFFADEEDGGKLGAHWAVDHRPELFAGATEAISEVGGYSVHVDGHRAYLLQTGEKAMIWLRLRARRPSGHGSKVVPAEDNAVTELARAIVRLTNHDWPVQLNETSTEMIRALSALTGADFESVAPDELALRGGDAAAWLRASLRTTANPTMLDGGYKHNVIPETASVAIDVRPLPGQEADVLDEIQRLVGDGIEVEVDWQAIGAQAPSTGALVDASLASLRAFDPDARIIPYLLPAGTDNKSLARLGIDGYGFAPLQLPAELNFPAMFHGVDERVPLESLVFGRNVLEHFLRNY
jgi:acetylornithine deacetylase/succinyl-diaminopimelate desuccinylase-like protein